METSCTCNAVQQADPTRTTTMRVRFAAEFRKRYKRVLRLAAESIIYNDAFGLVERRTDFASLVLQQAAEPGQFANKPLSQQVEEFDDWYDDISDEVILGIPSGEPVPEEPDRSMWFSIFIIYAFLKGMRRGRAELAKMGKPVEPYSQNISPRAMIAPAIFSDKIDYLLNRTFANIKNVNDTTRLQLRTVLAEALAEGVHPREIARRVARKIDEIGVRRALLIARTEIIAAHHLALIAEYRQAGVLGIRIVAEWLTARDGRVCQRCNDLSKKDNGHGPGIYTLDQIEFMIPVHPQCRCMALPVDLTDAQE